MHLETILIILNDNAMFFSSSSNLGLPEASYHPGFISKGSNFWIPGNIETLSYYAIAYHWAIGNSLVVLMSQAIGLYHAERSFHLRLFLLLSHRFLGGISFKVLYSG